jgi:hypothetical protein
MKKTALILVIATLFFSCGKENSSDQEKVETKSVEDVQEKKYSVILDAIYEKNDTVILQVYDVDGNEYLDKDVVVPVVGSPLAQRIELKSPSGVDIHNIAIVFSTNKKQDSFTLKSISMTKDGVEVVKPDNFLYFFANNDQMIVDPNTGVHKLLHEKVYHPAFGGNEQMKAILESK